MRTYWTEKDNHSTMKNNRIKKERSFIMGFLFLIITVLLVDLGIKSVIEDADPSGFPRELEGAKGMVMLHKKHNDGLPMGAFRDRPDLVRNLPVIVLSSVAGIFFWLYPQKGHLAEKLGTSLVVGGGLSNVYDRMKRGYVVDYFSIQFKKLKKVVLNLGDVCIFLGAVILFAAKLAEIIRER